MPFLRRLLLLLLALACAPALHAQFAPTHADAPPPTPAQTLDKLKGELKDIGVALTNQSADGDLSDLRAHALEVQGQAEQLAGSLQPQLDAFDQRLTLLGPAPIKGSPAEAPEVAQQRRQLNRQKADLGAQLTQAKLLGRDSQQLAADIAGRRRNAFQARLASRVPSPFSTDFWVDPRRTWPDDHARLQRFGGMLRDAVREAWQPGGRAVIVIELVVALLLLLFGRMLLEQAVLHLTRNKVPAGQLRRSGLALGVALLYVLVFGAVAELVLLAVDRNQALSEDLLALGQQLVRWVMFCAYVAGLGRALLSNARPSWRLPNLSDPIARALRPVPWLAAAGLLLLGVLERINSSTGASLPATVTTRAVVALTISVLTAVALWRVARARRREREDDPTAVTTSPWVGLVVVVAMLATLTIWLALATGFVAFAFFITVNMVWDVVVVCSLYLLGHVVHDLLESSISSRSRYGRHLQNAFGVSPLRLDQLATLLSGVLRVLLVLLAIAAVSRSFGAGTGDLIAPIVNAFDQMQLGELTLTPGDLLRAVIVFVVGLLVVRLIKRWLSEQLLPQTQMDNGMQNSLLTLFGYIGAIVVFLLALATLPQVSLKGIAWIASALSVGIGFGLQAIVSNFICGLILLAERPVKAGDWVSLGGGVEGDIRRINVRATEIQLWDRSTMIVPNSQLVTQNVRNVTLANALGRIQFKLPMPLDTDATRAREIVLASFADHAGTLATPAPWVQLADIESTAMVFLCTCYIGSPRDAGAIKSELLLTILERLRQAQLPLSRPQDIVMRTVSATSSSMPLPGS